MSANLSKESEDPRVRFAAERTLLAWIRTGLAMMGFGFVVARFGLFLREVADVTHTEPRHSPLVSVWVGTALVMLGVAINLLAGAEHLRVIRRINRNQPYVPSRWSLEVVVAGLLAVIGLAMAGYLLLSAY